MVEQASPFIDQETGDSITGEVDEADETLIGESIVASMTEIGTILLRRGVYSQSEHNISRLDEHIRALAIPMPDGTRCEAKLAAPIDKKYGLAATRITIGLVGSAPEHYRAPEVTRKSVTLFGRKPLDTDDQIGVGVNKFFYPEAKDFERPKSADTKFDRYAERYFPTTDYKNKDGIDHVEVSGPIARLGHRVLYFANTFATEALDLFRKYDEVQTAREIHTPLLSESGS